MTSGPLESLVRLRQLAADDARRSLAECLHQEELAAQMTATIDAAIERETEAATSLAAGDAEVEAFAAWLRRIRPRQHAAHVAEDQAEADTARARIVLGAARAAVRVAEELLARHEAEARAAEERRAQSEIDETAQRTRERYNHGEAELSH
jgi:flagellar export protein FliJ